MGLDKRAIASTLAPYPDDLALTERVAATRPEVVAVLEDFVVRRPHLGYLAPTLCRVTCALIRCYDRGGTLFLCGNGGSFADSVHIAGELLKSFERDRSLTSEQKAKFAGLPDADALTAHLEQGLRAYALGNSNPLATAIQNDNKLRDIHYAQDLFAMGRPGDVLLGISTSGNATNVLYAVQVARALGMTTIGMTGENGGKLAAMADIAIKAPGTITKYVQEDHFPTYHAICAMIEAYYFPKPR
ncbi:MAG TPA: SIS domain-containing protein [Candidatus Latescibacteria bacterium]|nr:SIS domain-containing protein [Candidatus Latescibacterota bacterium]